MKIIDNYWLMENKQDELYAVWCAIQKADGIVASDGEPLTKKISQAWEKQCQEWEKGLSTGE